MFVIILRGGYPWGEKMIEYRIKATQWTGNNFPEIESVAHRRMCKIERRGKGIVLAHKSNPQDQVYVTPGEYIVDNGTNLVTIERFTFLAIFGEENNDQGI